MNIVFRAISILQQMPHGKDRYIMKQGQATGFHVSNVICLRKVMVTSLQKLKQDFATCGTTGRKTLHRLTGRQNGASTMPGIIHMKAAV